MRIFRPSDERLIKKLVNHVYFKVQANGVVRVEDMLYMMATIVAVQCIEVAKELSIDKHNFELGNAVFPKKINETLIGPDTVENWNELPKECVFGRIKNKIDKHFNETAFPSLTGIFKNYTKNVDESEWEKVTLNIPEDSIPSLLTLRAGYETKKFVDRRINLENNQKTLTIAIDSLSRVLIETRIALNPSIALMMTFETIFGMSKTATMANQKMLKGNLK
ncbi:hypothetical protein GTQ34_01805 [Muricauda sp. JGD-17]|uniref:Uncharacterized protein n=1 Tax=Flagellimonas ochracea TaxID=2696472 RepID=A0A964WW61_9FLAO|nr:hypothetical protein [Allomuricauda ochracea]NAY90640.1 hypothetical protein [Allomuricauda ochracea]